MNLSPMNSDCKSIFKKGDRPTRIEYTKVWIDMINQIENQIDCNSVDIDGLDNQMEMACSNIKEEQA